MPNRVHIHTLILTLDKDNAIVDSEVGSTGESIVCHPFKAKRYPYERACDHCSRCEDFATHRIT